MKYEITEEQIKELPLQLALKWFPNESKLMLNQVFETKLEVGKWYKDKWGTSGLYYITEINGYKFTFFGFSVSGNYTNRNWYLIQNCDLYPASDSEVLEALTNEAKKRGFVKGVCFNIVNGERESINIDKNSRYGFDNYGNKLLMNNWCIFENGKWAEIIKTYTKEEAEKMLNAKIV